VVRVSGGLGEQGFELGDFRDWSACAKRFQLKVRIDLRVAELRVLAAQTALDYWRPRPRPPRHTIPPPRTGRRGSQSR
jgi:hypothetical protein